MKTRRFILYFALTCLLWPVAVGAGAGDPVVENKAVTGSLLFDSGATISEFSTTMADNDTAIPTGGAIKTYGDANWSRAPSSGVDSDLGWFIAGEEGGATDTTKIQAAIDAAELAGAGVVYIPYGTWALTATLTVTESEISILGDVRGTYLTRTGNYGETFHVNSGDVNVKIEGFSMRHLHIRQITSPQTSASVAHIRIDLAAHVELDNLAVEGGYVNFLLEGVGNLRMTNCFSNSAAAMTDTTPDANSGHIYLKFSTSTDGDPYANPFQSVNNYISNVETHDNNSPNTFYSYNLRVDGNDGLYVTNSHFGRGIVAELQMKPTTALGNQSTHISNCYFDMTIGSNVIIYDEGSTGRVAIFTLTGNQFRDSANNGILIASGTISRDVQIVGNVISAYADIGIYLESTTTSGVLIASNEFNSTGDTHAGVPTTAFKAINSAANFSFISNSIAGAHDGYAINVGTGGSDSLIANNHVMDAEVKFVNRVNRFDLTGHYPSYRLLYDGVLAAFWRAENATTSVLGQPTTSIWKSKEATDTLMTLTDTDGPGSSGVGNLAITGALSKGSGTFKITHPLDEDKWLYHSFIEGPRADLIYRGKAQLIDGFVVVDIDKENGMTQGTFEILTQNPQIFLQNVSGWDLVKGNVIKGNLSITSRGPCNDTISWMVIAERADEFIKNWDLTDEDGHLIPEWPKKTLEAKLN